jgi:hypothetical protein
MPSHANAFEISDIQEERNREPVQTSDQNVAMDSNVMERVAASVNAAKPGSYTEVEIPSR